MIRTVLELTPSWVIRSVVLGCWDNAGITPRSPAHPTPLLWVPKHRLLSLHPPLGHSSVNAMLPHQRGWYDGKRQDGWDDETCLLTAQQTVGLMGIWMVCLKTPRMQGMTLPGLPAGGMTQAARHGWLGHLAHRRLFDQAVILADTLPPYSSRERTCWRTACLVTR